MDDAGGPVRLVWKCRRPSPCAPWRWELRRVLDTMYESRSELKYNKLISQALPQWSILWRDVGVESPSSYWPSRRSVLGRDADLSLVDEEYSVDTAALVHRGNHPPRHKRVGPCFAMGGSSAVLVCAYSRKAQNPRQCDRLDSHFMLRCVSHRVLCFAITLAGRAMHCNARIRRRRGVARCSSGEVPSN